MLNRIIHLALAALLILPAAVFAVQLPATGQTGCFDGNGTPRPCSGSGEDGEKRAGIAWPVPRFGDNGNGTMTDGLTGLIWSKNANAPVPAPGACQNAGQKMSWQQALDFVKCLNANGFAGSGDWRLPNLNELESMVNAGAADSSAFLNGAGFGQAQASLYWSSTNDDSDPKAVPPSELNAWDVDLAAGDFPVSSAKTALRGVWPVRGASAAPARPWQTGQTKCFDTAGARINPCTGTGQDGETLAGEAWPLSRFRTNPGATVAVDNLTGLAWTTESTTPGPAACGGAGHPVTWQAALDHVKCLNKNAYLGITDWRLPNRKELRSLADYASGNPALPDFTPFAAEAATGHTFWSSTTDAAAPKTAWAVSLFDGSVTGADKRNALLPVWPVTGPDATPPALTVNGIATPTRVTSQTVSGTVEAGITPVVTVTPASAVGPVTVGGTGWSCVISGLKAGNYAVTVTAADPVGNTTIGTAAMTVVIADGSFSGGGAVSVADALRALRIAVGLVEPSADDILHGDVAPPGAPDDRIDAADALLILKKAVGLAGF